MSRSKRRKRNDTLTPSFFEDTTPWRSLVIRFDGGNTCNNPNIGYGDGYGSFQIGDGEIVRLEFGTPMSNNAAEVNTLVAAIRSIPDFLDHSLTRLCIYGDSQIALSWAMKAWNRAPIKSVKYARSPEFLQAIHDLYIAIKDFGQVATKWEPRERIVAIFGH